MLLPEHRGNSGFGVIVDPFDASSEVSLDLSPILRQTVKTQNSANGVKIPWNGGLSHGLSRRQFTREFKLAALQRLETGASVAEVARAFEVKPDVLHRWRREFRQGPGNAFPGLGKRRWEEGQGAQLERKLDQQALEITSPCLD